MPSENPTRSPAVSDRDTQAFRLMQDFYCSQHYDPKPKRPADQIENAIAYVLARLAQPEAARVGFAEGVERAASAIQRVHRAADQLEWMRNNRPSAVKDAIEMWVELSLAVAASRAALSAEANEGRCQHNRVDVGDVYSSRRPDVCRQGVNTMTEDHCTCGPTQPAAGSEEKP